MCLCIFICVCICVYIHTVANGIDPSFLKNVSIIIIDYSSEDIKIVISISYEYIACITIIHETIFITRISLKNQFSAKSKNSAPPYRYL